jgi:leader peptidase (prepilin peptidase) / N-methyltransferase
VQGVIVALATALGLVVGSFLNVVIYRVPAGLSIVRPPSACPDCFHPIRYRDNVPLLSWIALRGRCRDCGAPISARYPLIEALTATAFGVVSAVWISATSDLVGAPLAASAVELIVFLYLAAISIALGAIDLDVQRLPDAIVIPSYAVAGLFLTAAALVNGEPARLLLPVLGGTGLVIVYFLLWFFYPGGGGMGFGDVKLAGVLGIFLGWFGLGPLLVGAFAPFALGGLFAIVLMVLRKAGRKTKIPFGPWMLLGAWVGISFGKPLFELYLHAVGLT